MGEDKGRGRTVGRLGDCRGGSTGVYTAANFLQFESKKGWTRSGRFLTLYVHVRRLPLFTQLLVPMSTASSPPEPTSTRPAPEPTQPVAGQTVEAASQEFRWTAVPDAETYRLQLAATDAFDTVYYDDTVNEDAATVDLADVLPADADAFVWRVRIASDEQPTAWSTVASVAVGTSTSDPEAQLQVDAPPVPIRPITGDAVEVDGVTLTWEGVPEAAGYRVQVAPSEAFDEPVVDLTLDQTTTLTLFDALPADQERFYWRVQVLFAGATAGAWSESVQFEATPDAGDDFEPEGGDDAASSIERSAVAAGPAREAHTSSAMAVTFIGVLIISFLLTLLAIQMVL